MTNHRLLSLILAAASLTACSGGGGEEEDLEASEACAIVALDAACPAPDDVEGLVPAQCGAEIVNVTGPGEISGGGVAGEPVGDDEMACCYPVEVVPPETECVYGRPFETEGGDLRAAQVTREDWCVACSPAPEMSEADRVALAALWSEIAADEHAAVASFARVAMALMALGAPAQLVDDTLRAARDEVAHAKLAFGLAGRFAGAPLGPDAFPLGPSVPLTTDLVAFAVATARGACVAETLSTVVAAERLAHATDPDARRALHRIVVDESRHAALGWATLRWAIDAGGAPVREAVAAVFDRALRGVGGAEAPTMASAEARACGLLDRATVARATARGLREVVAPAARALCSTQSVGSSSNRARVAASVFTGAQP